MKNIPIKKFKLVSLIGPWVLALIMAACTRNTARTLPEFKVVSIDHDTISSESLHGKVVLVKLWSSWCGPCLADMDQLNQLRQKYSQEKRLVFLAVSDDSAEKVRLTLQRYPLDFIHIAPNKKLKNELQSGVIAYIPEYQVYDTAGRLIWSAQEPGPQIAQTLDSIFQKILN